MQSRRTIIWSGFVLVLVTAALQSSTVTAGAAETQLPGVRVNVDQGFVFDMNANGDYVVAWAPAEGSRFTKVLRGSAITGPTRRWSVASGFSSTPDVAIAANGAMALSWTNSPRGQHLGCRFKNGAVWNASDSTIVPHLLNRSCSDAFDNLGSVDLAINSSGTTAFTWVSGFRGEQIGFAVGRPDGTFTPTQKIFKDRRAGFLSDPEVSLDDAENVAIRWGYLGLRCRDALVVPKNCRNRPSSLSVSTASSELRFAPVKVFGRGCEWGQGDSTTVGQIFALALCRSGFNYTTAFSGQPFSPLQNLDVLQGNRVTLSPRVKILENGRVVVAYESHRYSKHRGPFAQIGGSTGTFGSPMGPPSALTAEVDHSRDDANGGYFGSELSILEGPGSQPYIAAFGDGTNTIAALDRAGNLGEAVNAPGFPYPYDGRLSVAPGGLVFSIFTKERVVTRPSETSRASLWTSSFALPPH